MNKRIQAEGPAAGAAPDSIDKPEEGKVYALTGGTGSRCIAHECPLAMQRDPDIRGRSRR